MLFLTRMRIITYNVNGLRAAITKGFLQWLEKSAPDVLCLQEIKVSPDQLPAGVFENIGYHVYWYPAQKKGYSGVALLTRKQPLHVEYGMGMKEYDDEGRVLRADFEDVSVMSVYHPSGSAGDHRQSFKMRWLGDFRSYIKELRSTRSSLVLSGDFNICHRAIDIHNPIANAKTSGFLPEEREWMENFLAGGFVDSFRHLNPQPHQYSWWSYRAAARSRNKGWRIDYNILSQDLLPRLKASSIHTSVNHSDHCPVEVVLG